MSPGPVLGKTAAMNLSALFPPTLLARLLDDIGAIADAARTLPRLEREVISRLDALYREMAPIQQLTAVRDAVEPLSGQLDDLAERVEPIQQLTVVREELESLHAVVDGIANRLSGIDAIREGIDPLDDDMRQVRNSVDGLEPLLEQVNARLGTLDERMEALRADLAPLGELADKIPGIG